eukprot:1281900-Amphidinium_carterae.1
MPPQESDVLVVHLGSLVSSSPVKLPHAVVVDTGSPHDLVGSKWLAAFRTKYPQAIRELPPLAEETTYCFGGQERDSTTQRVEISIVLPGQHVIKPILSVLSGCAKELPALLGRASLERERVAVDCATRTLSFGDGHVKQPLEIDHVGHYVFEAIGSFLMAPIGAGQMEHPKTKKTNRRNVNMLMVSLCQVLASTIALPGFPAANPYTHAFGVQEQIRYGHQILLTGNLRDIHCYQALDVYPQDVQDMLGVSCSMSIPDPEALEILVSSQSDACVVLHYASDANVPASKEVRAKGHAWIHLPLDINCARSDIAQHVYAGRLTMKECSDRGRKCLVYLNDKGVPKAWVSSVLRSAVQYGHPIVLKTYSPHTWGKLTCVGRNERCPPLVRCPFVSPWKDARIVSTFPLYDDSTLLENVLAYLGTGMDDCRRQLGIDQCIAKLLALLSKRRCVPKAPQRTNVPGARSVLLGAFGTRGAGVTRSTHVFDKELQLIHALASLRTLPRPYMSVSLNQGAVHWHIDKNNSDAPSDTISFGTYKGGLLETSSEVISTRHVWTTFNAHMPHRVQEVVEGVRWSVSLYSPKKTSGLTRGDMRLLRSLGFPLTESHVVALPSQPESKRRKKQEDSDRFYVLESDDDIEEDIDEVTEYKYKDGNQPDGSDDELASEHDVDLGLDLDETHLELQPVDDDETNAEFTGDGREVAVPSIQDMSDMFKQWNQEDRENETRDHASESDGVQHAGTLPDGRTYVDHSRKELPPKEKEEDVFKAVRRLHRDLGHPPPHALARALALRGAREDVIHAAQEFRCSACEARRNPVATPAAKLPSALSFGDEVGIDTFKVFDSQGGQLVMLNVVDHFTGFQTTRALGRDSPSSETVWKAFVDSWVSTLGKPAALRVDNGAEFLGAFLDGCESAGIQVKNNPRLYPQHNSIAERRGGFAKWIAQSALAESGFLWTFDES